MNRIRILSAAVLVSGVIGITACGENLLEVPNETQPDTRRVLASAADAENLVTGYFKRFLSGLQGSTTDMESLTSIMSFMNFSSLANNAFNTHTPFTSFTNINTPGNIAQGEQNRLYNIDSEVNRVATNFLTILGSPDLPTIGTPAQDLRAKSFAEFLRALSIGYTALMYDSLAVVSVGQSGDDPGTLIGYKEAFDSSMAAFALAIQYASDPIASGPGGFPLKPEWIPGNNAGAAAWDAPTFVRLLRTYRARLRAQVARTKKQRDDADWPAIIADAQNGIQDDFKITTSSGTSTGTGIVNSWASQFESFSTWHQMPPLIIGMADNSGTYAQYLATPLSNRGAGNQGFFMTTPDQRFPQGSTRTAQQADFSITSCSGAGQTCKRYFLNRNGNDEYSGAGWGWSNYDFVRFHSWRTSGDAGSARVGLFPFFTKAEIDLLQAEGLLRTGQGAAALPLINKTRVGNGKLPPLTAADLAANVVPGGVDCVPKVPSAASQVPTCGSIFEAMKWEKRIEVGYTTYSPWYLDSRGWGDLAENIPLFWVTPFQELQARHLPIYSAGNGVGTAPDSWAPKGTYGW
jgi:hypothetical protein